MVDFVFVCPMNEQFPNIWFDFLDLSRSITSFRESIIEQIRKHSAASVSIARCTAKSYRSGLTRIVVREEATFLLTS